MFNFQISFVLLVLLVFLPIFTANKTQKPKFIEDPRCVKLKSKVTVKPSFQSCRYLGQWYVLEKTPNTFQDKDARCDRVFYDGKEDGSIAVKNAEIKKDDTLGIGLGQARQFSNIAPTAPEGHLQVQFSRFAPWMDYLVIDTDYCSFSVVFGCEIDRKNNKPVELVWILARSPAPLSSSQRNSISKLLKANGIDEAKLAKAKHTKCDKLKPHFPN